MSNGEQSSAASQMLNALRAARKSPAVLKMRLILLRRQLPDALIFAFEGGDDKIVYRQWISRIAPNLVYEPFPCSGKRYVLELRNVVARDLNQVGDGVFFFIDRDFDDLAGFAAADSTYMTDTYSVENYLVSASVLDQLLKNEFHCHGRPDVREPILDIFQQTYEQFLAASKDLNRRLFVAKRIGLQVGNPTEKLSDVAVVSLRSVQSGNKTSEACFPFFSPPDPDEEASLTAEFETLHPRDRYRGKYALSFFQRWLQLLADDYGAQTSTLFADLDRKEKVRMNELGLGTYASVSTLPESLVHFLNSAQTLATN